ncbi:leishmanolysin-like peptidase [Babylonia areolata]|uniref:leishmanolysin-like peptidase n=1 Tax=Babylonia areolata TaxID=304850 RepID=UPI003FD14093
MAGMGNDVSKVRLAYCVFMIVHYTMNVFGRTLHSAEDDLCRHTVDKRHEVTYDVDLGAEHEVRRRSVDQPLRIHLYFDHSVDYLPPNHSKLIKAEVKEAVKFWEKTLKVRATQAPIRLRRQCLSSRVNYSQQRAYCINQCAPASATVCGEIVIPEEHLEACYKWDSRTEKYSMGNDAGPGVTDSDFILYIASIHSRRCRTGRTVAYAAHCQQERALDRPVAGYFSICPHSISDSWQERQQLRSTMKHEILHALGFTAGLYAFYRDSDGNPLTKRSQLTGKPVKFDGKRAMYMWSDKTVKQFTRADWSVYTGPTRKVISMMVTPKVKREVREHFGCPTLEGAELEDQGVDGTAITHWEKRIFENEAMTGTYTQNSVISRITLAMMEDTGWYEADYSMAQDYEWGKGLGCEFVTKSCYHWISTRLARNESIYPYCRRVKRGELWTDCTHNRHAVALCNLVEYAGPLPEQYQYFSEHQLQGVKPGQENRYGGSVMLANYCPYLQEFSWTSQRRTIRGSSCLMKENSLKIDGNFFGEYYGEHSRCFKHDGQWLLYKCGRVNTPQHSGSGCYKVRCDKSTGLWVEVGNQSYPCYHEGYVHRLSFLFNSGYLHTGAIVCPACSDVCSEFNVTCPPDRTPQPSSQQDLPIPCRASSLPRPLVAIVFVLTLTLSSLAVTLAKGVWGSGCVVVSLGADVLGCGWETLSDAVS